MESVAIMTNERHRLTEIMRRTQARFRVPAPCSIAEWAERERWLPASVTAKPGPYRVDATPYVRAWMDSMTDPEVQVTVLMVAKRLGKTEVLFNAVGHTMDQKPRNILFGYPTLDSARKASRQFFMPMVRSSPALSWRVKDTRQRGAGNTILAKEFPGGCISFIGSHSSTAFRQVQAPVVIMDEIDAMTDTAEGDPVTLAFGRAENYPDCVQALSSTPTIRKKSRIESWYDKSDKNKWHVACQNPDCKNDSWILAWTDVRWPDGRPEDAEIICPCCGQVHNDADRVKMVKAGRWKQTAPFSGIRGYWLNGLNSLFPAKKGFKSKLHQFAAEFLQAKHQGSAALMQWTNTFLAETWEDAGEQHTPGEFDSRLETYPAQPLPAGVLLLAAGADVHPDRIEAEIIGFGDGMESWGITRAKILGDTLLRPVWDKFFQFLDQRFAHPCGAEMKVVRAHIDSGGTTPGLTKMVYRFCGGSGRQWYAVKGASSALKEPVQESLRKSRALFIDTIYFKNQIHDWLKTQEHGPRFMHFPNRYDGEFFAQLCAEKRSVRMMKGRPYYTWENVRPNSRNEALDIRVYAFSAAFVVNPDFEALKKWRAQQEEKHKAEKKQQAQQPQTLATELFQPAAPRASAPRQRVRVGNTGLKGLRRF